MIVGIGAHRSDLALAPEPPPTYHVIDTRTDHVIGRATAADVAEARANGGNVRRDPSGDLVSHLYLCIMTYDADGEPYSAEIVSEIP